MKKILVAMAIVTLAVAFWTTSAQSQQPRPVQTIMKAKLKHAQTVIEGLSLENFVKLQESAKALSGLSRAAEWNVHKSPQYIRYSKEFRQITTDLEKHAKEKNLDACTLDYIQMTLTCVACHKHVRSIVVAQGLDVPNLPVLASTESLITIRLRNRQ
jgi:hypothetical protein